jgi:phosphomannomutase
MDFTAAYLQQIENLVDFSIINKTGLRVAIDSMAGAGGKMLENILKSHGIHAETINGIPQADFGGRLAEPIAQNLGPLADFLKKGNFSLGFATDGDADRLGVMDELGNFMNIQETILYLAQHVKKYRRVAGPLVKTASVTDKLLQIFPEHDNMVLDVQVGFKYVAEAMQANSAAFGAEESGGFGFKEHLPERDGIYSALMFLEMMAAAGINSLKAFINEKRKKCGEISYDRIDVINDNPSRHEVLPLLGWHPPSYLGNFQILSTQSYINSRGKINGLKLRLDGNPRWLLIRVSETEPMVRIYAEAENNDEIPVLLGSGKKLFEEYLQKPKTFNQ